VAGDIDPQAPIHLIGHSAGGFVVGEAGHLLTYAPSPFRHALDAIQVTFLDTPLPWDYHVRDYPDPGYLERIISSHWGGIQAGWPPDNAHYVRLYRSHRGDTPDLTNEARNRDDDHAYAHLWYTTTILAAGYPDGFYYSPLLDNGFYGYSRAPDGKAAQAGEELLMAGAGATTNYPLSGFESFGGVVDEGNGVYRLVESANAGLYLTVAFPQLARSICFNYQFIAPGDGDFLSVHVGSNRTVYVGVDTEVSRSNAVEAAAFVREFAGTTNLVTFKLVSRGESNAVLRLSDIRLEYAFDTDGDGIGDDDETDTGLFISAYDTGTDPALPDTDGDGMRDGDELVADTVPTDGGSTLRMLEFSATNGSATVRWSGGVLATQCLERTADVSSTGGTWTALFTNLPPTETEETFTDTTAPNRSSFYRIRAVR
jgi:hypothetical protein